MTNEKVVKKAAAKAVKTSRPRRTVTTKAAQTKVLGKTQKKKTNQKKPTQAPVKTGTIFRLEAPQATQVSIAGCFNEWDPTANPLERDDEGIWSCSLAIEPGEHEYRFVVDGAWCDDPANICKRPNEFGTENCILIIED